MKLLIVEDERIIREGLLTHPDWNGMGIDEVRGAETGDAALALLPSFRPDIVLSDIRMPGMNGLDMCRIIKQRLPEVAVIILTSYDDKENLKAAIDIGVAGFIEKPLSLLVLRNTIRKIVPAQPSLAPLQAEDPIETNFLVRQAKRYMEDHYWNTDFSVRQVASAVFVTPQYLSSIFKAYTDQTPGQYLTEIRIGAAKRLLSMPQYKLYEVAALVGYTDSNYFSRVFHKLVGCTPFEYRSKYVSDK